MEFVTTSEFNFGQPRREVEVMATGLFDKVLHKNKSTRTPQDLVPKACQALEKLQEGSPQKLFDDNTNLLASLKAVLLADNQSDQLRDYAITVGYEGCKMDLPLLLASKLGLLEFEAKKDAAQIFGFLVRLDNGGDKPGVRFVQQNPDMLDMLFKGWVRLQCKHNPALKRSLCILCVCHVADMTFLK